MNDGFVSFSEFEPVAREELNSSTSASIRPSLFAKKKPKPPINIIFLAELVFPFAVSQLQDHVTLVNPGVSQLCIRGDGKLLASAGWDHRVRVFGWRKLRPLAVLHYHSDTVQSVAFSDHQDPRHRLLAAGSKDQRISLWSIYNQGP